MKQLYTFNKHIAIYDTRNVQNGTTAFKTFKLNSLQYIIYIFQIV